MFIRYFKGEPSSYILRYRNGRLVSHGAGLTFFHLPFNTGATATVAPAENKAKLLFPG